MAMKKCRECGTDVSDAAKTCPKCGIAKPVKQTSSLVRILGGLFVIVLVSRMIAGTPDRPAAAASQETPLHYDSARQIPTAAELAGNVTVKDFQWKAGGFGSIMILSKIVIENKNSEAVKDFAIECHHSGPSGTVIDRSKKVIYQILPAGKTTTIKNVNMGFMQSQSTSSACSVVSVNRINA